MHELSCPSCSSSGQYNLKDYLLICSFCSATFHLDLETGEKTVFADHFIVPNSTDAQGAKALVVEWIKRLHHKPGLVERDYFVTDIVGISLPYWVISMDAHSVWKGFVKRETKPRLELIPGSDHLLETGQFKRSYRWAVSGRQNLFEFWGLDHLHQPRERISVAWDGFPIDSTLSRGRLEAKEIEKNVYDQKEVFDMKFLNGLPMFNVQVDEDEALRRAKSHVVNYHQRICETYVEHLIDHRTELDIAGIQLLHIPMWFAKFVYKPKNFLGNFMAPKERNAVIDGCTQAVVKGEIPVQYKEKIWINAMVTGIFAVIFLMLASLWHGSFILVSLFFFAISGVSAYLAFQKEQLKNYEEKARALNQSLTK